MIYDEINPGIAIANEKGLFVLVVRNAQDKNVIEISQDIQALVKRYRKTRSPLTIWWAVQLQSVVRVPGGRSFLRPLSPMMNA